MAAESRTPSQFPGTPPTSWDLSASGLTLTLYWASEDGLTGHVHSYAATSPWEREQVRLVLLEHGFRAWPAEPKWIDALTTAADGVTAIAERVCGVAWAASRRVAATALSRMAPA